MCQDCGCGDVNLVPLEVQTRILARNDAVAAHNRVHFSERFIFAVNLMGSPGAGKTAVLEATARAFKGGRHLAAFAGDLATDNDARRLEKAGIRSKTITTGQACHLDAEMVHHALHHFDLTDVEYFFIENVGNLVCPAVYDLGQAVNVVALSVTEGEDKPVKYPTMFAKADLVLLTKVDLMMHLPNVRMSAIEDALAHVMPEPRLISISAQDGFGVGSWIDWLTERRRRVTTQQLAAERSA
jgi:hydrogenase nickel incorporation protein HypB